MTVRRENLSPDLPPDLPSQDTVYCGLPATHMPSELLWDQDCQKLICCSGGRCLFLMVDWAIRPDMWHSLATFSMHLVLKEDRKNRRAFLSKAVNISLLFTYLPPTGIRNGSLESTCRPESGEGGRRDRIEREDGMITLSARFHACSTLCLPASGSTSAVGSVCLDSHTVVRLDLSTTRKGTAGKRQEGDARDRVPAVGDILVCCPAEKTERES